MTVTNTTLSTTGLKVARVGHGLMQLTWPWRNPPMDDDTAFAALKASLDLVGPGDKVFLNTSEFYGINPRTANLLLLSRFFAKYPNYRERAFISLKGGMARAAMAPDCSPENLRASVTESAKALGDHVKMDLFQPARLDKTHSVEEVVQTLKEMVDEGLFSYIGLSEVNAETLRRASKIAQITAVEIEVSPWAYDESVKNAIAAAKELGIAVIGYSPLGRGFLTGSVKKEELAEGDFRKTSPRWAGEAGEHNQAIVDKITELAKKKGVSNAQLCIAWVASLGDHVIPLPGSSNPSRTIENFAAADIAFTPEEKAELDAAVDSFQKTVVGDRYPANAMEYLML